MILKVSNKAVDFFNKFTLGLKYDSVASAFSFEFYFNPDNPEHKVLFAPGGYRPCTLEHNGETLITGTLLANGFPSSPQAQVCTLGGYSTPGVLEDCEIPVSIYPLQSDGLTLRQIANKIINEFGLKMVVDPAVNSAMDRVFKKSVAREQQSVQNYLTELAAQKNITLSHTTNGELYFTTAKTKQAPILHIDVTNGSIPGTNLKLACNYQAMHSSITVLKQADADGGNAGQSSITNPYGSGAYRPRVKLQTSGDDITTSQAARNALSEELRNIKLTITTDRWVVDGKILKPNNIISITNPKLFLFKETKWFIESIDFTGDNTATTAVINCVLPEVYNNKTPVNIFI